MPINPQTAVAMIPLAVFMFVSSITPGPNNLMLLSSGLRFGFRRSLPHALGVTVGLGLVLTLSFGGVGALLLLRPQLLVLMNLACAGYLLWLAAALLRAGDVVPTARSDAAQGQAMKPTEAILFQFVNPKVWAMAVTACGIAARFPLSPTASLAMLILLSTLVNFPCVSVWAAFGETLQRRLQNRRFRGLFKLGMAILVLATALWMARPLFGGQAVVLQAPLAEAAVSLGR